MNSVTCAINGAYVVGLDTVKITLMVRIWVKVSITRVKLCLIIQCYNLVGMRGMMGCISQFVLARDVCFAKAQHSHWQAVLGILPRGLSANPCIAACVHSVESFKPQSRLRPQSITRLVLTIVPAHTQANQLKCVDYVDLNSTTFFLSTFGGRHSKSFNTSADTGGGGGCCCAFATSSDAKYYIL